MAKPLTGMPKHVGEGPYAMAVPPPKKTAPTNQLKVTFLDEADTDLYSSP